MQLSKLVLRTPETALKGGDKGSDIVPGNADQRRLYRLVAGLEKPYMPMDGKLTAEQVSAMKDWINQGPILPRRFQKPAPQPLPTVGADLQNPVDRFLQRRGAISDSRRLPAPTASRCCDALTFIGWITIRPSRSAGSA